MIGARAIGEILKREGVEQIFLYPDNRVLEGCAEAGVKPLQARTERTAIAMADGFVRANNGKQIGVVVTQYGPGIENAFGGVAQAFSDSSPLIVICGNMRDGRYGVRPEFDPVPSFRDITKWAVQANTPERLPMLLRHAFSLVRAGRPGPVLIDVPVNAATGEVPDELVEGYTPVRGPRTQAGREDLLACVDALAKAERPVIHAGQGVLYSEATPELVAFAETLAAPTLTTMPGKGAFPEDHPLALGSGGASWPKAVEHFLRDADLIVGIGSSLTDSPYSVPIPSAGKTVVQLSIDELDFNKDHPADHLIMGDAKLVLRQMLDEFSSRGYDAGSRRRATEAAIGAVRADMATEWRDALESEEVPISPYRVIIELSKALDPRRTMITHDAGKPRDQLTAFWPALEARSYLGWGKSTHLGYGLGLIMGAKLARPDLMAVNVMGDAAIGMSGMEIETAVRLEIPIMTVILNNGAMSCYEDRYPFAAAHYDFKYLGGNYAALADALGATGHRVSTPDQLAHTFARARREVEGGGVVLVEVMTKEEPRVPKNWYSHGR